MRYILTAFIILFLLTAKTSANNLNETLVISHFEHPQMAFFKKIIKESYNSIGIMVEFKSFTADRGLRLLSDGKVDGDVIRNDIHLVDYPSLKLVQELTEVAVYLICRPTLPCSSDLLTESTQLIGAYNTKIRFTQDYYKDALTAELTEVSSFDDIGVLISKGRLDYGIMSGVKGQIPEAYDKFQSVTLFTFKGYHVVHQKHAHLVPALSESIRAQLSAINKDIRP